MDTYTTLSNEQLEDLRQSIYTFAESFKIDMQDVLQPLYTQIEQQHSALLDTLQQTSDIAISRTNQFIQQLRDILFTPENQAIYELIEEHIFLDEDMEDLPIPFALDLINDYYEQLEPLRLTFNKDDITVVSIFFGGISPKLPFIAVVIISGALLFAYLSMIDD